MKKFLNTLRQNKALRIAVRKLVVVLLTIWITLLSDLPKELSIPLAFILDAIIKYINISLLGDVWVKKPIENI